jgi:copper chaperone
MTTETFSVPKISCDHCVMTIKRELEALDGVVSVAGNSTAKEITVSYQSDGDLARIRETMDEIGYPVAS